MVPSGLPPLRWLLAGALAAGLWVGQADRSTPRPPRPVEKTAAQRPNAVPRPAQPAALRRPAESVVVRRPPARIETPAADLPRMAARPSPRPAALMTGSVPKPGLRRLATTAQARLRATADPDAKVLATLPAGTPVERIAQDGAWRLVAVKGKKGWVHASLLAPAPPRPPLEVKAAKH